MSRQRKRPKGEPTFVAELPIAFSPAQRRKARARFNCGTALYNAALREAINRAEVMRADPRWAKAREMPATAHGAPNTERRALFEECRTAAGFTESEVMSFGSRLRVGWLRDGVPAQEAQVLARTAFQAVERWVYRFGAGRKGRPRFKSMKGRGLRSMASKDSNGAIRVTILHDPDGEFGGLGIQWTDGFHAPLTIRDNPVHTYAVAAVQDGRALSARIVRRQIKGRDYYYAQITLDGSPLQRYEIPDGIIGLDLGPSTVAAVSDTGVTLEQFCDGLDKAEAELRREQRHLDRQHRAGSPECFDDKGRHKPGRCVWARSNRAAATALRIREAHRVKAEHRKSLHWDLVNRLLGQGRHVHVEDLSKVAWQKMFGRSVGFHAPGAFETLLIRRAVSAGGSATKITRTGPVCLRRVRAGRSPRSRCPNVPIPACVGSGNSGISGLRSSRGTPVPAGRSISGQPNWSCLTATTLAVDGDRSNQTCEHLRLVRRSPSTHRVERVVQNRATNRQ